MLLSEYLDVIRKERTTRTHQKRLVSLFKLIKLARQLQPNIPQFQERDYLAEWNAEHPDEFMDLRLRTIEDERADRERAAAVATVAEFSVSDSSDADFESFVQSRVTPPRAHETKSGPSSGSGSVDGMKNQGRSPKSMDHLKKPRRNVLLALNPVHLYPPGSDSPKKANKGKYVPL